MLRAQRLKRSDWEHTKLVLLIFNQVRILFHLWFLFFTIAYARKYITGETSDVNSRLTASVTLFSLGLFEQVKHVILNCFPYWNTQKSCQTPVLQCSESDMVFVCTSPASWNEIGSRGMTLLTETCSFPVIQKHCFAFLKKSDCAPKCNRKLHFRSVSPLSFPEGQRHQ